MAFLIVPHLVGQYGDEFIHCVLGDQRVEQDDASGLAEADEEGIGLRRAFRSVHLEDALHFEALAGGVVRDRCL